LSAFIEEGNIDALTRCSILLRASSTPPRYQPAAIHEQTHGVSKGQVSYLFKRRTMFPDKFLKPHWDTSPADALRQWSVTLADLAQPFSER